MRVQVYWGLTRLSLVFTRPNEICMVTGEWSGALGVDTNVLKPLTVSCITSSFYDHLLSCQEECEITWCSCTNIMSLCCGNRLRWFWTWVPISCFITLDSVQCSAIAVSYLNSGCECEIKVHTTYARQWLLLKKFLIMSLIQCKKRVWLIKISQCPFFSLWLKGGQAT